MRVTKCTAALLCLILCQSLALAGEDVAIRCRWASPNTRTRLDYAYQGNPLIIMNPGDNLEVSAETAGAIGRITVLRDGQPFREDAVINFTAPEKAGAYYIPVIASAGGRERQTEVCVVIPFKGVGRKSSKGGFDLRADDQEIGEYRHTSRSGNAKVKENPDCYQPPVWWFRITQMNAAFELVPGLPVNELVAPAEDTGLPHTDLVPVCYPMWETVFTLRRALEERKGIPGSAMKLISVFRAPPYNRAIGSNAFGRHIYGDAFDFYIDLEGDDKASDLNRDGKLDRRDAYPIIALIEDLQAEGKIPMGGVGIYNTAGGDHIVTMHLDMRGHRATWGYLYSAGGKRSEFSWASRRFADLDREDERKAAERAAKEGRKYVPPNREPLP